MVKQKLELFSLFQSLTVDCLLYGLSFANIFILISDTIHDMKLGLEGKCVEIL